MARTASPLLIGAFGSLPVVCESHLPGQRTMDEERLLENERLQIQLIRELDMEELEVEEVDGNHDLSSDDESDSPGASSLLPSSLIMSFPDAFFELLAYRVSVGWIT